MPSLKMVGPIPTSTNALATKSRTDSEIFGLTTPETMHNKIEDAVAPYASKSYVDLADGDLVTKSYVDSQDLLRMPSNWRGAANGVAELTSGAIPASRFPAVPVYPIVLSKTWRNTDFTVIPSGNAAGTGEYTILESSLPLTSNGRTVRFMAFGNFEGWAANVNNNTSGKPVFKVFINGYLCATSAGRNGAGSGVSSHCTVIPVGDDLSHTPGTGWAQTSASIRVTINSAFDSTAVTYAPTQQTILTVYLVYS